jgi:hypothetical protein
VKERAEGGIRRGLTVSMGKGNTALATARVAMIYDDAGVYKELGSGMYPIIQPTTPLHVGGDVYFPFY